MRLLLDFSQTSNEIATDNCFVSATKIGENVTNILNCYFSKQIYPLTHQTKYVHAEK